jgi:hypothetical protein
MDLPGCLLGSLGAWEPLRTHLPIFPEILLEETLVCLLPQDPSGE